MCDFIGFTSYVNTGPQSQIAIDNISESGWEMTSVTYVFVPQFSLTPISKQLTAGVYGLQTKVTTSGNQSFVSSGIDGQSLTWKFNGMDSGEGAGWKLGLGGGVKGDEINGTKILAEFTKGLDNKTIVYEFQGVSGTGVSFNASSSVPEPSGLALIGMLVSVLVTKLRRQRSN